MPTFSYLGMDREGQEVAGTVHANTLSLAINQVRGLGYFPTNVSEAEGERTEQAFAGGKWFDALLGKTAAKNQVAFFTRELANLVSSGISLSFSLSILCDRQKDGELKSILHTLAEDIRRGLSFSEALGAHPALFDRVYVNVVRAGEANGTLEATLNRLADLEERRQALEQEVRRTAKRVLIAALVGYNVLAYLFVIVFPIIPQAIFSLVYSYQKPLDMLLSAVRQIIVKLYFAVLGCILGTALGIRLASRVSWLKAIKDRLILRLPLIGPLARSIAVAQFARTLSVLLDSRISTPEAFRLAKDRISNRAIADSIEKKCGNIREDEKIEKLMERSGAFPSTAVGMIAVGEKTGKLDLILPKVAELYEGEMQFRTKRVHQKLMTAAIAVAIVFFVASTIFQQVSGGSGGCPPGGT